MEIWLDLIRRLPGVRSCAYEPFPFDVALPQIRPGRVVLPAVEPGVRPYARWEPADGFEVAVARDGLLLGRFVVLGCTPTSGVAVPLATRERLLAIAACAAVRGSDRTDRGPSVRAR